MLVSFTVENWMSFLSPPELSMIASRETHHAEYLSTAEKFKNLRLQHESDGTRRAIELLPMFLNLEVPSVRATFVVDELDRSLHTHLVRALLESFLDSRGPSARAQLLFTTHDVNLIDQDLFRRDELWVTERDHDGASRLIAFSDYMDVRADKDIRKSYLQGRLGGVPRISLIPSTPRDREALQ